MFVSNFDIKKSELNSQHDFTQLVPFLINKISTEEYVNILQKVVDPNHDKLLGFGAKDFNNCVNVSVEGFKQNFVNINAYVYSFTDILTTYKEMKSERVLNVNRLMVQKIQNQIDDYIIHVKSIRTDSDAKLRRAWDNTIKIGKILM